MGCQDYVPPGSMCGANHCSSFLNTSQAVSYCKCIDWQGKTIPGCTPKTNNDPVATNECYNKATGQKLAISFDECLAKIQQDPNWTWQTCYCCCSCLAWFTRIAISQDEVKFIQDFQDSDPVYAASIDMTGQGLALKWETKSVGFSDGTGPGESGQEVILLQYGESGEMTVTPDQPFLMPDGTLKRADRLMPGDFLVGDHGEPVPISSVLLGLYTGGIHHIATDEEPESVKDLNGHLLSANGVIVGDYWLQILQSEDQIARFFAPGHDQLPVIGSDEFLALPNIQATPFSATLPGATPRAVQSRYFEAHEDFSRPNVPAGSRPYVTARQAADIKRNAPSVPITVQQNLSNFKYLEQLYAGFFPDVNLYLEWADQTPNMYGFVAYGQKTVYISGRLLRTNCIQREGLALILAHGIALFYGNSIADDEGLACTGQADYFGMGYVLRTALPFTWSEMATAGYIQVSQLFGFIDEKNRGGDPGDLCARPSIDCRLECLSNALSGKELPPCAGGPVPDQLRLEKAEALLIEGEPSVVAYFNEAVSAYSAEKVTNYVITPESVISTAVRDTVEKNRVVLTVTFPAPPEGEYTLKVSDIYSEGGSTLDPKASEVSFTVAPQTRSRRS